MADIRFYDRQLSGFVHAPSLVSLVKLLLRPFFLTLVLLAALLLFTGATGDTAQTAPQEQVPLLLPVPLVPLVPLVPPPIIGPEQVAMPLIQPFDLDATRRMAVDVMVEGQGPYSFLVDTGAERTVISRELAARLAMVPGQKLRLATISGSSQALSYKIASLSMTHLRFGSFEAPALNGRDIGAAGLLGVDLLQKHRILISFVKEEMLISESHRRARPVIRDSDAIVVKARNLAGRLILSNARIGRKRVNVIVDTGAQTSVGNLALQKLVQKRRQNKQPFYPTTLVGVAGLSIEGQKTTIKRITIEGVDINNLPISFVDAHAFKALDLNEDPALLLGMDTLRLFDRVEIDFPNRRIIFDLPSRSSRRNQTRFAMAKAIGAP